jgi:hypothetical protein
MEGVKTRSMTTAKLCGVCWQSVAQQGELDCCSHVFCLECVVKWAQEAGTCPICRASIRTVTQRWLRVRVMQKCLSEAPHKQPAYDFSYMHDREIELDDRTHRCNLQSDSLVIYMSSSIGRVVAMMSRILGRATS